MGQHYTHFWTMAIVCALLTALVVMTFGVPANAWTFIWFNMPFVFCLLLLKRRAMLYCVLPLLPFVIFVAHTESDYLMDVRGGRSGIEFLPYDLRFSSADANSRLVEDHLGTLPAQWKHRAIRTMPGMNWRDGNDRLHSRSLLFRDDLAEHLEFVPDREARKQVLLCITDPDNKAKFHQEMLLICLKELGFPPGHDSQSWWQQHQTHFTPEHDAKKAAILAGGWTQRIQWNDPERYGQLAGLARSVEYDDDGAFQIVEEIVQLRRRKNPPDFANASKLLCGQPVLPALGYDQVAWWSKVKD